MNSLPIGLLVLAATCLYSFLTGEKASHYFQIHSMVIVGVGTIAVFFLSVPTSAIRRLLKLIPRLFHKEKSLSDFEADIQALLTNKTSPIDSRHPILQQAQALWERGVSHDLFIVLLSEKRSELESANMDVIHSLKNWAKYPPALGMLGTVMGMMDLFSSLDKNQDAIGNSLSVAMTATLLGLILSNMIISPLADRLHVQHMKEQRLNASLYELMLLINGDQAPSLIREEVQNRAA